VGEAAREHRPQNATATITGGDGGAKADQASGPHAEADADPGACTDGTAALTLGSGGRHASSMSAGHVRGFSLGRPLRWICNGPEMPIRA